MTPPHFSRSRVVPESFPGSVVPESFPGRSHPFPRLGTRNGSASRSHVPPPYRGGRERLRALPDESRSRNVRQSSHFAPIAPSMTSRCSAELDLATVAPAKVPEPPPPGPGRGKKKVPVTVTGGFSRPGARSEEQLRAIAERAPEPARELYKQGLLAPGIPPWIPLAASRPRIRRQSSPCGGCSIRRSILRPPGHLLRPKVQEPLDLLTSPLPRMAVVWVRRGRRPEGAPVLTDADGPPRDPRPSNRLARCAPFGARALPTPPRTAPTRHGATSAPQSTIPTRPTRARSSGVCSACGEAIGVGDVVAIEPTGRTCHLACWHRRRGGQR